MNLLHIMAGRRNGGAETYCADLILSLHAAGVDQCVVMPSSALRFGELKAAGVRLVPEVLAIPLRQLQRFRLARVVMWENPDVIHCWMRRAASLAPKTSRPVIGWFGDLYDPVHFTRCSDFVGVTRDIVAGMEKDSAVAARARFIPTFADHANTGGGHQNSFGDAA